MNVFDLRHRLVSDDLRCAKIADIAVLREDEGWLDAGVFLSEPLLQLTSPSPDLRCCHPIKSENLKNKQIEAPKSIGSKP